MATLTALPSVAIAGIHHPPTKEDLAVSLEVYNTLPHPEEQPEISDADLMALGEIFVRHQVQNIFGIHLLHSHFTAPDGTVLLGIDFQPSSASKAKACWTRPVSVAELATDSIHGHVFRLQTDGTFIPYEFHEGQTGHQAAKIGPAFLQEFAEFLRHQGLVDLVALEVLDSLEGNRNLEILAGPQGTVVVDERDLLGFSAPRITTGWSFQVGDDGIISCKGDTTYASKKNTHQVFVGSKPLPTVDALKKALQDEGIVV